MRILAIDDDPVFLELLAGMLKVQVEGGPGATVNKEMFVAMLRAAGMDDAAVVAGLVLGGAALLLEHKQAFFRIGLLQLHGGGHAQNAAANNDEIPHESPLLCQIVKIY